MSYLSLGEDVGTLRNQLALAKTQLAMMRTQVATYRKQTATGAAGRKGSGARGGFKRLSGKGGTPATVQWGKIYDLKKAGSSLMSYNNLNPNAATIVSAIDTAKDNVKALEERIKGAAAASRPQLQVPTVTVPAEQSSSPSQPPVQQQQPPTQSTQPSLPQPSGVLPTPHPYMPPPGTAPVAPQPYLPAGKKPLNKGLVFGGAAAAAVIAGMFLLGD